MAQRIETRFIDDLDGGPADGTVRFALDGTSYEIDLSAAHTDALRAVLARYTAAARRITGASQPGRAKPDRPRAKPDPAAGKPDRAQVRDWARTHGMEVKDRGRIPAELIVRFQAATGE